MFPCSTCDSTKGFKINEFLALECKVFDSKPCVACVELEKLGAKIRETRLLLEQMAECERALKSERNRYHDPLVKHLPLEIASRIFTLRFRLESSDASSTHQSVTRVPLTLGAVCRTWNAIARSTPQLWTFVPVKLDDRHEPLYSQLTREWLCRSGQLGLSIRIYPESGFINRLLRSEELPEPTFDSIIDAVNEHSNRWQGLEVSIPKALLARLQGSSHDKSILQNLSLSPLSDKSRSQAIFRIKNGRPSPKKVTICRMALTSIDISWDHVTHVEVDNLDVDQWLELLRQAQQLTHCSIHIITHRGYPFLLPTNPVVHHFLRSLEFQLYSLPDLCVSLPALQNLVYHTRSQVPYDTLDALIARSSCHLTALSIDSAHILQDDQDLISLLRKSPSIQDLSISSESCPIPMRLFDELSPPEVPPSTLQDIFLPHLQSLRLSGARQFNWSCIPHIFPEGPIIGALYRPLSSFEIVIYKCVDFEYVDYVDDETVQRLVAIINNGVSITIVDDYDQNLLILDRDS